MNCGLGNLASLKKHLLADTAKNDLSFDPIIADIGRGVAAQFEQYCNRKFARVENDTVICTADRDHFYVPRYPLETFTQIELKTDLQAGWELQALVLNTNPTSGLVYWGAGIAYAWAQLRITYTGGFFFEQLEPDDETYPSQLPAGAAALPEDLRFAWLLQCRHVWAAIDKLGVDLVDAKKPASANGADPLAPTVADTLFTYTRMQLL